MKNNRIKNYLKKAFYAICTRSLIEAAGEQGLDRLSKRLEEIVPDISEQYSAFKLDSSYLRIKARNMHAFQIGLVNKVLGEFQAPCIVDIGDSAGTHIQYIKGIHREKKQIQGLSINLDRKAIQKIRKKGMDAIEARAEDLSRHNVKADILLCFETLEHLTDPVRFLRGLSETDAKYLIITVPYLRKSRMGLSHIRKKSERVANAETTHIFELNKEDWKLLARHSGWDVAEERIYAQYPRMGLFRATQPLWKKYDFEGFLGFVLKKDDRWSSQYQSW